MALQMDCIALVPQPGGFTKETISVPDLKTGNDRYPQATRAGQFVFVSNTIGINPQTGKLAVSLEELGEEAHRFAGYRFYTAREEAVLAQTWFTFQNIGRILESQGGSLAGILQADGWLGITLREFKPIMAVRETLFPVRDAMPASASIGISGLIQDGALLAYDCTALVPPKQGRGYHKEVGSKVAGLASLYVLATSGGPLVFTCGEVPIDAKIPKVIKAFDDLDDEGKLLPFARMHAYAPIQAQAWFVYKKIGEYLSEHGASFADVVHHTVFIRCPTDYPALERVSTLFFGSRMPPTSVIPITDTSPYPETMIEIQVIAAR